MFPAGGQGVAGEGLAPFRYQPGRLVPPGEALWAAVKETNMWHFFVFLSLVWVLRLKIHSHTVF